MRYVGPKNKISRREKTDLGFKTPGSKAHASLLKKLNLLPGQHGIKSRRKSSERARQLREKQKLRFLFGVTEKQLKNYFKKAKKMKGNTGLNLSNLLEKRLDNIVYRLGFAPTRAGARQLVSHRHVIVNSNVVNIPSYQVTINQNISLKGEKTQKISYVASSLSNKNLLLPNWTEKKGIIGKIRQEPNSEEIDKQVDLRSVIEFYSR